MQLFTWNNIIGLLRNIAEAHWQVQSFGSGSELEASLPDGAMYPRVFAVARDFRVLGNTVQYRVNLQVMDLVDEGQSDADEVLSDTLLIGQDFVKLLRSEPALTANGLSVQGEPVFLPFREKQEDCAYGWAADLVIQAPFDSCYADVPIDGFGSTGYSGSGEGSVFAGRSGFSGASGFSGTNGSKGSDGSSGVSGFSGPAGANGFNGLPGESGFSGPRGMYGGNSSTWVFSSDTVTTTTPDPGGFKLNKSDFASAGTVAVDLLDANLSDFSTWLFTINQGDRIRITNRHDETDFAVYEVASKSLESDGADDWYNLGVNYVQARDPIGSFTDGAEYVLSLAHIGLAGAAGDSGVSGFSGVSGVSGFSGRSGFSGPAGAAGAAGASGVSGFSGATGASGFSGVSGFSGATGASGFSGVSGFSGRSGFSGPAGAAGSTGTSGVSGFSGFSGVADIRFAASATTVPSTSTTSEEILASVLIPANTLTSGDRLVLSWMAYLQTGSAAGTKSMRVRLHTSATIGGTVYALLSTTSTGNITWNWVNKIVFKDGSSQEQSPTGSAHTGIFSNAPVTSSLSVGSDMYLLITSQKGTGTDSLSLRNYDLKIEKA